MSTPAKFCLLSVLIVLYATGRAGPGFAASSEPPVSMTGQLSAFDTIEYIHGNHLSLASQAESISHWAAYYSVNPILLIHVVKAQALAELLTSDSIKTLAGSLGSLAVRRSTAGTIESSSAPDLVTELQRVFSFDMGIAAEVVDLTLLESAAVGMSATLAIDSDAPPALDLPFDKPQAWQFNGVHTWTGDDDGSAMSSIDFTRSWTQGWGDDTASDWVTSAHDGEVTVYSSCFIQIQHDSGWATRYYHLDNIQLSTGQRIQAGERLANYANQRDQALCSGGSSTGPHLHFALLRDGTYQSLEGVALSGYQIHPGESSYDSSNERMWLEKRGSRFFAFSLTISEEEGDNIIDYRYNGMWFSLDHSGHGLNIEITESAGQVGSRKTLFIVIYTYDDEGQANFYVGNRDFERWRSDESMVVEMLQTSGGDFSSLSPIDFDNPNNVEPVGEAELHFFNCIDAQIDLSLTERSAGQPTDHSINLIKLIGVPDHVCEAASLALPESE